MSRQSPRPTVLECPSHRTPEPGAPARTHPETCPDPGASRAPCCSLWVLPPLPALPGSLPFSWLWGHRDTRTITSPGNPTPPPRCSGLPPEQQTQGPPGLVFVTRELMVANSAGITVHPVATGPGPRVLPDSNPEPSAPRPCQLPGQGRRSRCRRSLNFHPSRGNALSL